MTNTGDINHPLIAIVCFFGYIIVSCVLIWLTCFITAARKGEKAYDPGICFAWPFFVLLAPIYVVVALWLLLRHYSRIFRVATGILTLPFRPTELGLRLYEWCRNKKSMKLKKEEKTDEQRSAAMSCGRTPEAKQNP